MMTLAEKEAFLVARGWKIGKSGPWRYQEPRTRAWYKLDDAVSLAMSQSRSKTQTERRKAGKRK